MVQFRVVVGSLTEAAAAAVGKNFAGSRLLAGGG